MRTSPGTGRKIPYPPFEDSVTLALSELKASDVAPQAKQQHALGENLARLEGQRAETAGRIERCKKRIAGDGDFELLVEVLRTLETRHKSLSQQIEQLRRQFHAAPHEQTLDSIKTVHEAYADATPEELPELRLRLKQAIRDLVAEMWVKVEVRPEQERSVLIDIHFRSGVVRCLQFVTVRSKLLAGNFIADFATKGKGWGLKAAFIKNHVDTS